VAASQGMRLLEKPTSVSRVQGGCHIYGNPHLTNSPVNMKKAAENIAAGLIKNDPAGKELYEKNLQVLLAAFDERLFGAELVKLLGGATLCKLAEKGKLADFLAEHDYEGKDLASYAGGWWKKMAPLRGMRIVTYHKNWIYFLRLFGLIEAGTVEPKPGIPPSPGHVADLIDTMKKEDIRILLSANYFSETKVESVAERTGAQAVIVPIYVGGAEGADDYFALVDLWVDGLLGAARRAGLLQ
jgi:ABC-type Zn uptake system ZnuABC Zn-binding protein ZnuA